LMMHGQTKIKFICQCLSIYVLIRLFGSGKGTKTGKLKKGEGGHFP